RVRDSCSPPAAGSWISPHSSQHNRNRALPSMRLLARPVRTRHRVTVNARLIVSPHGVRCPRRRGYRPMVVATIGAKSAAFLREKGRCPMPRRLLVGFSYALTALLLVLPGQTAAQRYGGWHGGGYRPAYVGYRGYGYGYYPRYLAYP